MTRRGGAETTARGRRGDAPRARSRSVARRRSAPATPSAGRAAREQQRGERGRHGQRDDHRGHDGQHIGQGERLEERARAALHDRDRHDREEDGRASRRPAGRGPAPRRPQTSRGDRALARAPRMRRPTAPAPTAASSTTTASAMASPAREIALSVSPSRSRTSAAAIRASGIVTTQTSRERHENRKRGEHDGQQAGGDDHGQREIVDRPLDEARGPEDRRVGAHPGQARAAASRARSSTPRVTSSVFGAGELLDHEHQAVAIVDDRVADQRLVVDADVGHVAEAQPSAGAVDGHLPELGRVGDALEDVAHLHALLRRLDEPARAGRRGLRKLSGETAWALPVVATTWSSVTPRSRRRSGSTCTCSSWSRMPQIGDVRDAGHAHQARADRPARDHRLLDRREALGGQRRSSAGGSTTRAAAAASAAWTRSAGRAPGSAAPGRAGARGRGRSRARRRARSTRGWAATASG